jgi:Squalene-hopene cyclase C-terminal domain/Prenyltransferase and squalene oxidase repeat
MLRYDPLAVIFRGDEVARLACLEFLGLSDSPQATGCLLALVEKQRSDGAFPSQFDPGAWGMLETVRHTLLLLKVGLPEAGVNVGSAVRFILGYQRPDGGWCENPSLELPADWTWMSNERSITWLTADVVDLLRQAGAGERPECRAAVRWLKRMQNRHGGWPSMAGDADASDPDATAQITFLMAELHREDDPAYLKGKSLFQHNLDECARDAERGYWIRWDDGRREELDAYTLTHLLLSWWLDPPRRFQHGYDVGDPRVRRMMEALVGIQREDGGWRPFFAEGSSPVYTLLALKALILSGALAREDLESKVRAYAA